MSALKKAIATALALSVFAPAFAFAQTATTTGTALVGQIQSLNAQIAALQQQRDQAVASLVNTIRQGTSGDQVAILQALLAADPSIYPEGVVSGFFGKLTAQAVKRFQKKHDLEQVGDVGPKTLKKLQEFLGEHPLAFSTASSTATSTPWMRRDGKRDKREGDGEDRRPCAIVPPGHLIAPGWLRKNDGVKPVIPECQKDRLPKGIRDLLERGEREKREEREDRPGTTTPPVATTTSSTATTTTTN